MKGFIRGYCINTGVSNILHVDIVALMHGVRMCWKEGLSKITCYIDSKHTLQ